MTSQRASNSPLLTSVLVTLSVIIAGWLSYSMRGDVGLYGSLAGSGVTLVICFVAHLFFKASAEAEGAASIRGAQLGIIVGSVIVIPDIN